MEIKFGDNIYSSNGEIIPNNVINKELDIIWPKEEGALYTVIMYRTKDRYINWLEINSPNGDIIFDYQIPRENTEYNIEILKQGSKVKFKTTKSRKNFNTLSLLVYDMIPVYHLNFFID